MIFSLFYLNKFGNCTQWRHLITINAFINRKNNWFKVFNPTKLLYARIHIVFSNMFFVRYCSKDIVTKWFYVSLEVVVHCFTLDKRCIPCSDTILQYTLFHKNKNEKKKKRQTKIFGKGKKYTITWLLVYVYNFCAKRFSNLQFVMYLSLFRL